jgi:hypothetical protein
VGAPWPFQRLGELQSQIDCEAKKAELVAHYALISQNASRRVPYPQFRKARGLQANISRCFNTRNHGGSAFTKIGFAGPLEELGPLSN